MDKDNKKKKEYKDPYDGEYIGNIWGWKFSYYGLGLILVMLLLVGVRYCQVGKIWKDAPTREFELIEGDTVRVGG